MMLLFRRVRDGNDFQLNVMVGRILPNMSDLHVIDSHGKLDLGQSKPWKSVGSGRSDADILLEKEWIDKITMKKFASLGYCIIKFIEEQKPTGSVGTGQHRPGIKYLGNAAPSDTIPTENDWADMERSYVQYQSGFKKYNLL
ncbi:MAG: hypothetical protein WB587_14435 [Nitrososphaeraceae archaeon]